MSAEALSRRWEVSLDDVVACAAWSGDGERLAVATLAGSILVLHAESGQVVWRGAGHRGGALSAAWSPGGQLLATGGQDGEVEICEPERRGSVARLAAGEGWVSHVVWSGDGAVLAAAAGRVVRFWSGDGAAMGEVTGHPSTVSALFWHPEHGFGSACYGGVFSVGPAGGTPRQAHKYRGSVIAALPSEDGRWVALGNQDASVRLWDKRFRNDAHLTGYPGKVTALAWARDSAALATAGGAAVIVWGCGGPGPRGTSPEKLEGHGGRVTSVAFLESGHIASAALDGKLAIWTATEEGRVAAWHDAGAPLFSLTPRRRRLAAAGAGGRLSMWES